MTNFRYLSFRGWVDWIVYYIVKICIGAIVVNYTSFILDLIVLYWIFSDAIIGIVQGVIYLFKTNRRTKK